MADMLITAEFKKDLFKLIMDTYIVFLEDNSPVKSGNLKRSWNLVEIEPLVYLITNEAEYAAYLDEGTGIYATKGSKENYAKVPGAKPIKPKTKKALSFNIGGSSVTVRTVKGIEPLMMIQKAASSKKVEKELDDGLKALFEKHFFPFK